MSHAFLSSEITLNVKLGIAPDAVRSPSIPIPFLGIRLFMVRNSAVQTRVAFCINVTDVHRWATVSELYTEGEVTYCFCFRFCYLTIFAQGGRDSSRS